MGKRKTTTPKGRRLTRIPKTPLHPERVQVSAGGDVQIMVEMLLELADTAAERFNVSGTLPVEIEKARGLLAAAERAGDTHLSRYASSLLCDLCGLRDALGETPPDPEKIARLAIDVGILVERVRVYVEAPWIEATRAKVRGLVPEAYSPAEKTTILRRWHELRAEGLSKAEADKRVSDEFLVGVRTLQRFRAEFAKR